MKILFVFVFLSSVAFGQNDSPSKKQKSKEIIDYLSKEIDDNPTFWNLYYMRAYESKKSGDIIGAFSDCEVVINNSSVKKDLCNCYSIMGHILSSQKMSKQAIDYFDKAIEIDSTNTQNLYSRAYLKFQIADDFGAIKDFNKVTELDPNFNNFYLFYIRGNIYHSFKDYENALKDFDVAININPNFASNFWCRGMSKYKLNDYLGAIDDYSLAIKINPNYKEAYKFRGVAKEKIGNPFCDDYKKACKLGDKNSCIWYSKSCD